ncbi:hypothetical protein NC653_022146 [Populus alba x Populus x berolinensis]|uniref:Uncharacterized protein n=1 Tax=Populus alba x Populus x berolinensis TaxID=444605 RepID=A0AAD6QFL4_9ROSI|nr:hypothetical protein NC653_022146 [Populus alba x Populus x berolinensis]
MLVPSQDSSSSSHSHTGPLFFCFQYKLFCTFFSASC